MTPSLFITSTPELRQGFAAGNFTGCALLVSGELRSLKTHQEVIRTENISAAYRTPVEVVPHPVTGAPLIFLQRMLGNDTDLSLKPSR